MEETQIGPFALSTPILYATSALVITAGAVVFGYMYIHKSAKDVSKATTEVSEDVKMSDARPQSQTPKATENTQHRTAGKAKESPLLTGQWPTDDPREVLPIPENAPEHLKKILEMGFPGCPLFRRIDQTAEKPKVVEPPKNPEPVRTPCSTMGPTPEVLAIPEHAPEHLKKVLEMGFPGCPMFRRMDKVTEPENIKPESQTKSHVGPSVKTTFNKEAPAQEVLTIPENCPEHLKKVLEMGCPGCPMFRRSDTDQPTPESKRNDQSSNKDVVANVFSMFENQFGDEIKRDLAADKGSSGDVFQCLNAAQATNKSPIVKCPRSEHCPSHCSCYKTPEITEESYTEELCKSMKNEKKTMGDEEEEEEEEEIDMSQKVFDLPDDAPENIKRILEMGFPGCPMFRRTPQTEALTKSGIPYPGNFSLSQILGTPDNHKNTSLKKADFLKKSQALMKVKSSKMGESTKTGEKRKTTDDPKKAGAAKNIDTTKSEGKTLKSSGKIATQSKVTELPSASKSQEPAEIGTGDSENTDRDPVEFCSHLQSEVKRTQQKVAIKKIEEEMTGEQKEHERDIQRKQLESIFKLMQHQEDKFGIDSLDDIQSQMKLYM